MRYRMWMYDLAREQSPTDDHLVQLARLTADAGYNGLGLYLEHRFAYSSSPWAAGAGALRPEGARLLQAEFPQIQFIPFLNLLGHTEGFLRSESGKSFAETPSFGMQGCPSNPEFRRFAMALLDDVLETFSSELVHLGGDETNQLAVCERCRGGDEQESLEGRREELFAEHYLPLLERTLQAGRRPAIWSDMLLKHPAILDKIPKQTLIFDWQYFGGVADTSKVFVEKGFEVVACPTLQTYNAVWMHLEESEANVRLHIDQAGQMNLAGVCLTTWEQGLFGAYDTLFPAIRAVGSMLNGSEATFLDAYGSTLAQEFAQSMGVRLPKLATCFEHSAHRSKIRVRFLLQANPFLAWRFHGPELVDPVGQLVLDELQLALSSAPNEAMKDVVVFVRHMVEFVHLAERAAERYAEEEIEGAISLLGMMRRQFDELENIAKRTQSRIGGSRADIERCRIAKRHIETVVHRVRNYGDGSLGYRPSFEHITDLRFVPHDQGAWWAVNRWAEE